MKPYYQDDAVTIYHGDCREAIPDLIEVIDLVVTDPPYGIAWRRGQNNAAGSRAHAGIQNDHDTTCRDAALAMLADHPAIVFGSFYAPFPAATKQVLIWQKPADAGLVGSITGYRRDAEPIFLVGPWAARTVQWSSVIRTTTGVASIAAETGHPHTKPVALLVTLISRAGGGCILDPFMGSGTTLRAAKDLGRKAIGIEIEERYCEIAAKRMSQEVLDLGGAA